MNQPPAIRFRHQDVAIAYTLLRIIFGINFFNHGFTRINNIGGFANSMAELFKATAVPSDVVRIVGVLVPPVELILGVLLIVGFATRGALVAGFMLMIVLQGGVAILKQWDTVASQLVYCLIFFLLLMGAGFNPFSLDAKLRRQRQTLSTDSEN